MTHAPTSLYVIVMIFQIFMFFMLNVLLDIRSRNAYLRDGGKDGTPSPMLEVRQDVKDHENEVRRNQNLGQDDENSYQIKAVDISKTYESAGKSSEPRMAVCKNTFGARRGEVFGLLGPNGAGKSTTFSMIAMQNSITSGNAELMGHDTE